MSINTSEICIPAKNTFENKNLFFYIPDGIGHEVWYDIMTGFLICLSVSKQMLR